MIYSTDTLISKHWHHLPVEESAELLGTDIDNGLDLFEVGRRKEQFGPNLLTTKKQKGALVCFLLQFHQPLVYILMSAAVVTAALQEWVDAGVIFGVVLVNAIIGFVQEAKALQAMEALAKTMTTEATVLRGSAKTRIPASELVPGDMVLLQSGDKVPADLRFVYTRELKIDESALTGESVASEKSPDALRHDALLADRHNMGYASTLVTYGSGKGIVVATGDATEVGRISQLIESAEEMQTPLTKKMAKFSHLLLYVILGLGALTFIVGIIRGQAAFDMFMAAVALAVGAIPEGLPAAITITLAIGVARMAKKRAIIRKLPAVETLGSTTVICSDKTGTLTENQMTVQEVTAGGEGFELSGSGYNPSGSVTMKDSGESAKSPALDECLRAGMLCNDSRLFEADGRWDIQGDPTEAALIVSARKAGLSEDGLNSERRRIDAIPFESQHQYMATLHAAANGGSAIAYVKGSVEAVLHRSESMLNSTGQISALDKNVVLKAMEQMAAKGLRVLAFAKKELASSADRLHHEDMQSGLVFLGLQGMIDPPRQDAIAAIRACYTAGIKIKMITGDHALTASAIAAQIGLDSPVSVVTGKELEQIADSDLVHVTARTSVFARVSPEQKLRLVEALQKSGNIVAMTGDGVNDAPALKKADIGVAMGITGTDVAKEAADMVLTDDNFASIEAAVEEGRGVFDNLTKFIIWTLPTNIGEGLVILAAIFAGVTLPILPVQILWINMTTAVLLGLMLAFEPKEAGIMLRQPRDPQAPILTRELIMRIITVSTLLLVGAFGLFEWELAHGADIKEARTAAVNVFVMVELFYLFNCRSLTSSPFKLGLFSNMWIWGGVLAMTSLQMLYTYLPLMNAAFQSAPVEIEAWARIISMSLAAFVLIEIEKHLRRSVKQS
ncbi:MAG: cation-transporting P-type ATPase [Nitrospiraceae bacterium]|nr:cation-transporting P-type ATPase [Nitrospiraceae bacterium]